MIEKLTIKALTPVHIGDDRKLSPYSDYIYTNGMIHYVDSDKLMSTLNDKQIESFIDGVNNSLKNTNDNKYKFRLSEFLRKEKIDIGEVSKYQLISEVDTKAKEIKRFISTSGRAYIPGSSIKGAIRTAILYDYLKNYNEGNKVLDNYSNSLKNISEEFAKIKEKIINIEKELLENINDREKKKNLSREISILIKPILDEFKKKSYDTEYYFEKKLFGNDAKNDFMKCIIVTDTNSREWQDCIYVDEVNRKKISKLEEKIGIPVIAEFLKEEKRFNFEIKLKPISDNIYNREYFKTIDLEKILSNADKFYREQLENETKILENNDKTKKLIDKLNQILKSKNILIRIGGFKTFLYNTIMSLFSKEQFSLFREIYRIGATPKTNNLVRGKFPSTNSFLFDNESITDTSGWCEITKADAISEDDTSKKKRSNEKSEDIYLKLLQSGIKVRKKK